MHNNKRKFSRLAGIAGLLITISACKNTALISKTENSTVPASFGTTQDTISSARNNWRDFFHDPYLAVLIDTALRNNQELNITLQEVQIARNEVRARKGEYLPFFGIEGGAGLDKAGRYTNIGAMESQTEIAPGKEMPEPLTDLRLAAHASWELDIWRKLRNAKKSAYNRYLSGIEGKNFMVTNLVAEIARSYYELLSLDNQLDIINQNIQIQENALKIVKLQKDAAKVTELAVRRFEAQVLHTKSLQYDIRQKITEAENKINYLVGRYPQPVARSSQSFTDLTPQAVATGVPSQLLANRPDIRQAERELAAAKLDVKVARARFYPSLNIDARVGLQAFNANYFVKTPQSLLYSLAGDLVAPLINRNAIKAAYYSANSKQIQAVYHYEQTILNAYIEVVNQLAKINNLSNSYDLKSQQVQALSESVNISNSLFRSARADYMEVLLTQRDALESKFELVETKMQQLNASVNIYRALGGGWQ
jgi:multidrug efflux system outer membrane protein